MLLANSVDLSPPMQGRDHACTASQDVDEP